MGRAVKCCRTQSESCFNRAHEGACDKRRADSIAYGQSGLDQLCLNCHLCLIPLDAPDIVSTPVQLGIASVLRE